MNFKGHGRRDEVSLDMTPLIDVVFLLLIFFMLTASFTQAQRLKVELPKAEQGESSQDQSKDWTIEIDAQGNYALNGEALAPEQLESRLHELPGRTEETVILIRADARTEHQAVVQALNAAKAAGLLHIGLATDPSSHDE
ncbi:MAG: biopolymer transporter ExbD [Halothiobacillaceae bacterium]|nr:biopolymer transporter ExbD [Halothiobacillaceae bacterium]